MKHKRSHPPNLCSLHIHDRDTVPPLRISAAGDEYTKTHTSTQTQIAKLTLDRLGVITDFN